MVTANDDDARQQMLTVFWNAKGRAHELTVDGFIAFAVRSVRRFSIVQLSVALASLIGKEQPARMGLLDWVIAQADGGTRAQIASDRAADLRCLPSVPIDPRRAKSQVAILERWARPAASARWNESEVATIRGELERDAGRQTETWIERHRRLYPPAVLDPAVYGDPPDPNDRSGAFVTPEQHRRFMLQIQAKLAHLQRIGAGPRRVFGVMAAGAGVRQSLREPGEEG